LNPKAAPTRRRRYNAPPRGMATAAPRPSHARRMP
jgi:hypothetical protein